MSAFVSLAAPGTRRAILGMAAFGAIWALLEEIVGAKLQGRYHLLQVVWCRYAVHLVALGLMFGWRRPHRLWRTARPGYQMARSLMMLVMPASFVISLSMGIPAGTTMAVFWLSPILIIVIARLLLGERASWFLWGMAAVGAAVVAFMFNPVPVALPMLVIPAAMALSFSAYVVMTRSLASESVLANLFYTAFGVLLALTPLMPMVWVTPSVRDATLLMGIGVFGLVALFALDRAASLVAVSATASILYLQMVSVALVGLVNGHGVSRRTLVASVVIIAIAGIHWVLGTSRDVVYDGPPADFAKEAVR